MLILHPRNHLIKLVLITSITYFPAFTCVLQGIGPPWLDTVARTTEPNLPWPSTSPLAWECSLIYLKTIEDFAAYERIVPQQNSLVSAKLFLSTIPSILLLSSWLHLYRILNGSHKFSSLKTKNILPTCFRKTTHHLQYSHHWIQDLLVELEAEQSIPGCRLAFWTWCSSLWCIIQLANIAV